MIDLGHNCFNFCVSFPAKMQEQENYPVYEVIDERTAKKYSSDPVGIGSVLGSENNILMMFKS